MSLSEFEAWVTSVSSDAEVRALLFQAWEAGFDAAIDQAQKTIRGRGHIVVRSTRKIEA